jgi:hypothetical protein
MISDEKAGAGQVGDEVLYELGWEKITGFVHDQRGKIAGYVCRDHTVETHRVMGVRRTDL